MGAAWILRFKSDSIRPVAHLILTVEMGLLFVTHHRTVPAAAASTKMPSAEVDWLSPGRPLLDGFG